MKDELKHDLAAIRTNTAAFLKWLLFACLVGGVTGTGFGVVLAKRR